MSDDQWQIYIKALEDRLARQQQEMQEWPNRIVQFQRELGKMQAANYTVYRENEDLKKQIKSLEASVARYRRKGRFRLIRGPWQKGKKS